MGKEYENQRKAAAALGLSLVNDIPQIKRRVAY